MVAAGVSARRRTGGEMSYPSARVDHDSKPSGGGKMTVHVAAAVRTGFQGRVVAPGDEGYDKARRVVTGAVDKHPAAIAYVAGVDDVRRVVAFARDNGVELAVRSGGHSSAGHGVCDGVVLDVSGLKGIEIDPADRTAWAETGVTAGEFTTTAAAHGLAVGFGDAGSVGLGGITLGGGVGFLARKHGLTIDSLLAAELVTADGQLLRVDADDHPDLFWAIRGGGGNFGVATRFKFRLTPLDAVVGGMVLLPATADTVAGWVAEAGAAAEELTTIANVMPAPPMPFVPEEWHGKPVIMALVCYAGPVSAGEQAMAPFRALAKPIVDMVRPMPYPQMYGPEPEDYHPIAAARTLFTDKIDGSIAATVVERVQDYDAVMRAVQLRVLGGAVARVSDDATAYAHRSRPVMANVAVLCSSVEEVAERAGWVDDLAAVVRQGPDGGGYVGFVADEGEAGVRSAYPPATYARLAAVKAQYDPANLFHLNQNVRPADG